MDKDPCGIQVIARAAAILRAVGRERVSLGTLARQTGLPRSTVQRIVDALAAENFLEAGEAGVRLGWGLGRLAQISQSDVVRHARPALESLFAATRESVDISARSGTEVSFLDRIISDRELRVVHVINDKRALHTMANGKAMLSTMADADVERLMGGRLVQLTDSTIVSMPALLADLANIRTTGFSYDREEHLDGVCAIGTAITVPGLPAYAISIAVPVSRFDAGLEGLKAALRVAQQEIEAGLATLHEIDGDPVPSSAGKAAAL